MPEPPSEVFEGSEVHCFGDGVIEFHTGARGHLPEQFLYLYVVMDVFSRSVVGWMVAHRESAALAQKLLAQTCERRAIPPGQLTIHADRGTSMTSKPMALLMADLGVTKTHSRPHVSNDNPFREAHFKTRKVPA